MSRTLKLVYGFGFSADGIKNNSFNFFLLYYYQQIAGLNPTLCGLALLIALVLDAVADPIIGSWSDATRSRLGRRHPFLYASSLPFAIGFFCAFNPPGALSQHRLFAWLLCSAVVTRLSMSLFEIPHASLGAELSDDYDERASLQSLRVAFGWMFGLINALLVYQVFLPSSPEFPLGLQNPSGYRWLATWGACGVFLTTFVCSVSTQSAALAVQPDNSRIPSMSVSGLLSAVRSAFRISSYRAVILAGLCLHIGFGMSENLGLYVNTLFYGVSETRIMSLYIVVILLSTLLASLLTPRMVDRFDKRLTAIGAVSTALSLRAIVLFLRLSGVLAGDGGPLVVGVTMVSCFVEYTAIIVAMSMVAAMIADITDEHELMTGHRQEGMLFAAQAFLIQSTTGVGAFVAGIIVRLAGIPAGAVREQTPASSIWNLGAFYLLFISAFWILSLSFFRRYGLSRERHSQIQKELRMAELAAG